MLSGFATHLLHGKQGPLWPAANSYLSMCSALNGVAWCILLDLGDTLTYPKDLLPCLFLPPKVLMDSLSLRGQTDTEGHIREVIALTTDAVTP